LAADDALDRARRVADEDPAAVVAVVGPTASGKTELAIRLAESIGGEIVGADSVQIYRCFDLGSGKPTAEERARARHHLIDALDPLDPADAARFGELARAAIDDVRARGQRPIVCGGTFLWVKALLFGLAEAPPASEAIRDRHRALVEAEGRPALHVQLRQVDPVIAERLHPNDFVRVSRALEVHELTGEPMSAWQARHGFAEARVPARLLALRVEPDDLTRRIAARVDAWLAAGWIDEVRGLVDRGYGAARAMGSVGYREVHDALIGRMPLDDLAPAIVRSTRIFARRQRTWLHHADVTWL
jgi:tRNA dimethylallyltransferase